MSDFQHWWRQIPALLDPVVFQLGPVRIQYYGLMYLVAFGLTYGLVSYRLKTEPRFQVSGQQLQQLFTYLIIGLVLGARLGYVLFYNLNYYLIHPWQIFLPFTWANGFVFTGISGMSYHGGLMGTLGGAWLYLRRTRLSLLTMADLVVPAIPLGYTFGRLGNFINGELYGRPTSHPVGMIFPQAGDGLPRHPSQLYEAFFEGFVLFVLLWSLRRKIQTPGAMLALYLLGYGAVRFAIEYFRQPDDQLGFIWGPLTMGQILCALMMIAGGAGLVFFRRLGEKNAAAGTARRS
jgi:phosphatidylglycerol:prolipoprotein diacylglycerol transferase